MYRIKDGKVKLGKVEDAYKNCLNKSLRNKYAISQVGLKL
jgi:hypothetical protein